MTCSKCGNKGRLDLCDVCLGEEIAKKEKRALAFTFEDHCALMDAKHPGWLKGNHGATSLLAVAREFWEAALLSEAHAVAEQSCLELGAECPVCFPEGFDHDARPSICPQCSADTVQPRDGSTYCEECGWPEENREPNLLRRLWDRLLDFLEV